MVTRVVHGNLESSQVCPDTSREACYPALRQAILTSRDVSPTLVFLLPLGPWKIALQSKETNTFQLFLSLQEEGRTQKKISLLIVLLKERRKWGGGIIILPCPEGDGSSDTLSRHHKLCVH